ncbi:MAG TPA: hypothetical protein VIK96_01860 [Bacilli bacterium]
MTDQKEALQIWEHEFGNKEYAYDFTGKKIKRSDYMVKNQVGWVISYLKPLELGGKADLGNTIIMHYRTFEERGMQYPRVVIDDNVYNIFYCEKDDYYYIERELSDDDDEGVIL